MDLLSELATKHGTDKGPKHHNYTPIYDKIMNSTRMSVEAVLEIGLQYGSSAKMWLDYFPSATVYAVDCDPTSIHNMDTATFPGRDRLRLIQKEQDDTHVWDEIPNDYLDFVIDDGSHKPQDQYITFLLGFGHVKPGGLWVIEDCHCSFHPNFNPSLTDTVYDWVHSQIVNQQLMGIMSGNFYLEREHITAWLTRHIYSFTFYKSLIILERSND